MRNKPMDILCVTGTRADYGIYRPLLAALSEDSFFRLRLLRKQPFRGKTAFLR